MNTSGITPGGHAVTNERRPEVPSSNGDSGLRTAKDLKLRLFPGWWTHIGASGADRPLYRVQVHDDEELELAKQLEPACIRARYTTVTQSHGVHGAAGGADRLALG